MRAHGGIARTVLEPLLADQKTPKGIVDRVQIVMAEIATADIAKKAAANESTAPAAPSAATAAESSPAGGAPVATKKE